MLNVILCSIVPYSNIGNYISLFEAMGVSKLGTYYSVLQNLAVVPLPGSDVDADSDTSSSSDEDDLTLNGNVN